MYFYGFHSWFFRCPILNWLDNFCFCLPSLVSYTGYFKSQLHCWSTCTQTLHIQKSRTRVKKKSRQRSTMAVQQLQWQKKRAINLICNNLPVKRSIRATLYVMHQHQIDWIAKNNTRAKKDWPNLSGLFFFAVIFMCVKWTIET